MMLPCPEGLDGIGALPGVLVKDGPAGRRVAAAKRSLSKTPGRAKLAVKTSGAVRLRRCSMQLSLRWRVPVRLGRGRHGSRLEPLKR